MILDGKIAIITGGAKGMGATEVALFASEGAQVLIADILDTEGLDLESQITQSGGKCKYMHLNVTSEDDWRNAIDFVLKHWRKLDILVNNAGIHHLGGIEDTSEEDWDRLHNVNSKGTFLGIKYAIPAMLDSGGSIINISSAAGLVGNGLIPSYSSSKGAVTALTKSVAIEYANKGIRCNSIHPASTETDMPKEQYPDPRDYADIQMLHPMRRFARPEEVAQAVMYLASDESSYLTGSEVVVDGGHTAR